MIDLMRTHKVPLYRRNNSSGYLNEDGEWIQATFLPASILECNIQPMRQGRSKVILPDGVRTDSVIVVRTFTELSIQDHVLNTEGDEIEYKGKRYEAFIEEDFSSYNLRTDHYKYLFIRKDKT